MERCAFCKTEETMLFESGVCLKCADARTKRKPAATAQEVRTLLFQDLLGAAARNSDALRDFDEVTGQIPSGLPSPDGAQRIKNASNTLSIARKDMATAHHRLSDYLDRGIV